MINLTTKIGNLRLKNPVLVASGTFGYGKESEGLVDFSLLGGIVTKSVSLKARAGNPPPRIFEVPAGMLNSIGLANVGVETFIADKLPFLRSLNTSIIVNVAGSTPDEFVQVIEKLEDESGISAYELNFSCPNVKEGGLAFSQEASLTQRVTKRIKRIASRPVIVKLTPNVTRVSEIAQGALEGGADAVSLINTLVGFAININTRRPQIYTGTAGYSGPAVKPVALAKVFEVASNVKIPIVGIGGIAGPADALEFIIAGATAVQIGTANFIDPATGTATVAGIEAYCRQNDIHEIEALVGSVRSW